MRYSQFAEIAKHTVFALDANNGEKLWSFVAGGRVDSPPTYCAGLIVFGCRDGWVYCLKENDGSLVWRFRATESNTKIFSYGQLESLHPIHGSVLIRK